jgi:hypothetical protein
MLTKEQIRRTGMAETQFFRAIAGNRMTHRKHNKDSREELGITNITTKIKAYQKEWL